MDLIQFTEIAERGYGLDEQRIKESWEKFKTTNRTIDAAFRVLDATITYLQ